jgi:large subunit ribosomal protein L35
VIGGSFINFLDNLGIISSHFMSTDTISVGIENSIGSKHMPKMKSVKGAVKRFKVKKSGKIKRGTAYRSHILSKVDGKHHRQMRSPKHVDQADAKNIKEMIN